MTHDDHVRQMVGLDPVHGDLDDVTEDDARLALGYLLFEDGHSKVLSVAGARSLDVLRRWMGIERCDTPAAYLASSQR